MSLPFFYSRNLALRPLDLLAGSDNIRGALPYFARRIEIRIV
ncbi:hypothetical protein [Roseibium marinum]|nr:hypothetical protein [Roseibium marinum]